MKKIVFSILFASSIFAVQAQQKTVVAPVKKTTPTTQPVVLKRIPSPIAKTAVVAPPTKKNARTVNAEFPKTGLQTFVWHSDDNTLPKAKEGEQYGLHARLFSADGQMLVNDYGFMNNVPIARQNFGFMYEGILKMCPGDSAIFKVLADSMFGKQIPPFTKSGESVCFSFVMYTKEVAQKMIDDRNKAQVVYDNKVLQDYFSKNKITTAQKTKEGLYYVITQQGTGDIAQTGNSVIVNYTGKSLNGVAFDSNTDTTFHHVQPFEFKLNQHQVIPAWDMAFSTFKKGTKATIYVPSCLGYCENPPPGGKIVKNEILIFDVELVDIIQALDPSKQFDKYFAENNIKAEKTPEGLYYVITQAGTGEKPKTGQTVIANYTGKLLNGTKFDSNMEEAFHHVSPFSFALGQHMVITGWDLGFALLNKGAKATLYIPSNLAYGENGQGPIPANSPLIFDVELVDIK